ncbi:TPA: host cell division inhibitor Icd-like protein [Escherichia coli]|nr:host cell division inhibitor Icd-like protein [Escherichia coli]
MLPQMADVVEWIATADNRATWTFETSTRTGLFAPVRARKEGFSDITTRGGNHSTGGSFRRSTRVREGEFLESIKKCLLIIANPVYGYSAPAKSGAGIGVPITCIVPTRTKRVFLSAKFLRTQIMVGWMRLPKGRPVSIQAGYANLVQLTTSLRLASLGGEFKIHCIEAAIMATTPTQKPQFIWIIAAVRRDMPTITAKIHHIAAETEQEARRILARDHVCFFAGRIRTGGAHA